jgi:transcription initiation factor IIF auxiliary subunit
MFLSINNCKEETRKFIQKVVYRLHPVYKVNTIVVKEPPFLLSRTAYVQFIVDVEIVFRSWTELEPIRIDHLLDLKDGQTYSAILSVCDINNNEVEDMHNSACLKSELEKIQGFCTLKRRHFDEKVDEFSMLHKAIYNLAYPM